MVLVEVGRINGRTGYHVVSSLLARMWSGLEPQSHPPPPIIQTLLCTESDAHQGLGDGLL